MAPSSIIALCSSESGPIMAPLLIMLFPVINVFGYIVTPGSITTSLEIVTVSGEIILTPFNKCFLLVAILIMLSTIDKV